MNNGKAILAVLAGVAAGAALGVLFAPDKGSDTRKKISRKGEDLANALSDKIDDRFDELLAVVSGKVKRHVLPGEATVNRKEMVD
ncbi:YtxH domain-containing protein [Ohtaekwangia kribbensis]|jgi:gas vesicle protein|uniref:YtxH domain-containing protein n=1 Tax=Ohtaekwangia kribbensis TaxID=688913 RepID=A0ABW3K6K0_9BACT